MNKATVFFLSKEREIPMGNFNFVKRVFALGTVFVMLGSTSVFASNLGRVNGEVIKLRDAGSMNSNVLDTAIENQIIRIHENNPDGWSKVSTHNLSQVYIYGQYVDVVQTDATCVVDGTAIRKSPSPAAESIGTVNNGTVLVCTGTSGDFYSVKYDGTIGYIAKSAMSGSLLPSLVPTTDAGNQLSASDIKAITKPSAAPNALAAAPTTSACFEELTSAINAKVDIYALVSSKSAIKLMSEPSDDAETVAVLRSGYAISVYEYVDGWVKASIDDGRTGYVKFADITLMNGAKPENTNVTILPPQSTAGAAKADSIVAYSMQFIGTPYVYGGTNLTAGVDCSGFIYSIYGDYGISLNRVAADQYSQGTYVDRSELQPGDLVFFNTGGNSEISHVGMYIGNDQYIHSTDGYADKSGVMISSFTSDYVQNTYVGAKRILD